jgi:hypothetical protein
MDVLKNLTVAVFLIKVSNGVNGYVVESSSALSGDRLHCVIPRVRN